MEHNFNNQNKNVNSNRILNNMLSEQQIKEANKRRAQRPRDNLDRGAVDSCKVEVNSHVNGNFKQSKKILNDILSEQLLEDARRKKNQRFYDDPKKEASIKKRKQQIEEESERLLKKKEKQPSEETSIKKRKQLLEETSNKLLENSNKKKIFEETSDLLFKKTKKQLLEEASNQLLKIDKRLHKTEKQLSKKDIQLLKTENQLLENNNQLLKTKKQLLEETSNQLLENTNIQKKIQARDETNEQLPRNINKTKAQLLDEASDQLLKEANEYKINSYEQLPKKTNKTKAQLFDEASDQLLKETNKYKINSYKNTAKNIKLKDNVQVEKTKTQLLDEASDQLLEEANRSKTQCSYVNSNKNNVKNLRIKDSIQAEIETNPQLNEILKQNQKIIRKLENLEKTNINKDPISKNFIISFWNCNSLSNIPILMKALNREKVKPDIIILLEIRREAGYDIAGELNNMGILNNYEINNFIPSKILNELGAKMGGELVLSHRNIPITINSKAYQVSERSTFINIDLPANKKTIISGYIAPSDTANEYKLQTNFEDTILCGDLNNKMGISINGHDFVNSKDTTRRNQIWFSQTAYNKKFIEMMPNCSLHKAGIIWLPLNISNYTYFYKNNKIVQKENFNNFIEAKNIEINKPWTLEKSDLPKSTKYGIASEEINLKAFIDSKWEIYKAKYSAKIIQPTDNLMNSYYLKEDFSNDRTIYINVEAISSITKAISSALRKQKVIKKGRNSMFYTNSSASDYMGIKQKQLLEEIWKNEERIDIVWNKFLNILNNNKLYVNIKTFFISKKAINTNYDLTLDNIRTLSILPAWFMVLERFISVVLLPFMKKECDKSKCIYAYTKGKSIIDLKMDLFKKTNLFNDYYILALDVDNAYPSVSEKVYKLLPKFATELLKIYGRMHPSIGQFVFSPIKGIPQGSVNGPCIFNYICLKIIEEIELEDTISTFCDDWYMFQTSIQLLKEDYLKISNQIEKYGLKFKLKKSEFGSSKNEIEAFPIDINNNANPASRNVITIVGQKFNLTSREFLFENKEIKENNLFNSIKDLKERKKVFNTFILSKVRHLIIPTFLTNKNPHQIIEEVLLKSAKFLLNKDAISNDMLNSLYNINCSVIHMFLLPCVKLFLNNKLIFENIIKIAKHCYKYTPTNVWWLIKQIEENKPYEFLVNLKFTKKVNYENVTESNNHLNEKDIIIINYVITRNYIDLKENYECNNYINNKTDTESENESLMSDILTESFSLNICNIIKSNINSSKFRYDYIIPLKLSNEDEREIKQILNIIYKRYIEITYKTTYCKIRIA